MQKEKIQIDSNTESGKHEQSIEPVTKKAEISKDIELIEKLKELFDAVEYKIN